MILSILLIPTISTMWSDNLLLYASQNLVEQQLPKTIYLIIINVIMSVCMYVCMYVCMFTKNFWTRHCQTLKFCTHVHCIPRIPTKAGFYFAPTGSDVIGQWRHRANWEKFRQMWSCHIPLERQLNADSDSHNKHGLKMNRSRDITVYMMSRDPLI